MYINKADRAKSNRIFLEKVKAVGLAASLVVVHVTGRNCNEEDCFKLLLGIFCFMELCKLCLPMFDSPYRKLSLFRSVDIYREYQDLIEIQNQEIEAWSESIYYADDQLAREVLINNKESQRGSIARKQLFHAYALAISSYPMIESSIKLTSNYIQKVIDERRVHHINTKKIVDQLGDQLLQMNNLTIPIFKILKQ